MVRDDAWLLALEINTIFGLRARSVNGRQGTVAVGDVGGVRVRGDERARVVWAWSAGATVLALAPGERAVDVDGAETYVPGEPPRSLVRHAAALGGGATVSGGPGFVFPDEPPAPEPVALPVVVSDAEGRRRARRWTRPDTWRPDEWRELIAGERGEWAMAVHGDAPVSMCFTPALCATAAEAGVWTRPDFRGRRLAPAVVSAWSHREQAVTRGERVLFYSTSAGNHASRSVARRLGLAPVGWIWTIR